jgi:hypothetical protein
MDLDGSISTEIAVINKDEDYRDIVTMGLPLNTDGKPVPCLASFAWSLVPKGRKTSRLPRISSNI